VEEFSKALTSFQSAQRQEKVKEKQSNVRANRPPSASYVSQQLTSFINSNSSHVLWTLSLSLSHSRSGWGHRPNPFQVAPEVSWVGCEGVSWPGVPPCVIVGRTLEHQMLDRLVGAVAVWADGRVPAPDTVATSGE